MVITVEIKRTHKKDDTKKKSMKTTVMATMMKLVTTIWTKRIKKKEYAIILNKFKHKFCIL